MAKTIFSLLPALKISYKLFLQQNINKEKAHNSKSKSQIHLN